MKIQEQYLIWVESFYGRWLYVNRMEDNNLVVVMPNFEVLKEDTIEMISESELQHHICNTKKKYAEIAFKVAEKAIKNK